MKSWIGKSTAKMILQESKRFMQQCEYLPVNDISVCKKMQCTGVFSIDAHRG